MWRALAFAIALGGAQADVGFELALGHGVESLHAAYRTIFGPLGGNRNAASHLWASYVLKRSAGLSVAEIDTLFSGFCPVSGSIVRPGDYNRYLLRLKTADASRTLAGYMHYCCWPCVCDTQEFIRVDTKTVDTREGAATFHFAVIENPCTNAHKLDETFVQPFNMRQTTLRASAPAIQCDADGSLVGASLSDNGHVIIGMLHGATTVEEMPPPDPAATRPTRGRISTSPSGQPFQDEFEYSEMCEQRAHAGHNSGMGEIFRRVAMVTPWRQH